MTSLYTRLAAVLLLLFLAVGGTLFLVARYGVEMYEMEVRQHLNRDLAEHIAADAGLLVDGRVDQAALETLFHQMMVINPSIEVYLLDPRGRILAYSAPPEKVRRDAVDLAPIRRFLDRPQDGPILGADPRNPDRRKVFSAAPVSTGDRLDGYVYVVLGGERYDAVSARLAESAVLRLAVAAGVGALVFVLTTGLVLFAVLTRRLRRLSASVDDFSARVLKEADAAPPADAGDDLERLQAAFDAMAERISAQLQHIAHNDRLRRELVANVSHDLRTPLASIRGYLETLRLKWTSLTPEVRSRYLDVALRHTVRLARLVDELFELSCLEANDVSPTPEPFALGDLLQDVVQKHELAAERRGIRLEATAPDNTPMVVADVGLIERVLDNLVSNALRYTPGEGTVRLTLHPATDAVEVRVSDTGRGIPPQEQRLIFDRFYRVAGEEDGQTRAAGLGLAIAQRILDLHGRSIRVESDPARGSVFSFDLPVHRAGAG